MKNAWWNHEMFIACSIERFEMRVEINQWTQNCHASESHRKHVNDASSAYLQRHNCVTTIQHATDVGWQPEKIIIINLSYIFFKTLLAKWLVPRLSKRATMDLSIQKMYVRIIIVINGEGKHRVETFKSNDTIVGTSTYLVQWSYTYILNNAVKIPNNGRLLYCGQYVRYIHCRFTVSISFD